MARRTVISKLGFLAIAVPLVAIGLAMTPLVGNPSTRIVLLGSGLLILTASLILLQIRFFREGDVRRANDAREIAPAGDVSAPHELKNLRQRIIWSGMEKTRVMMNRKEEEARAERRRAEKALLGLDDEEEILYMGDRSYLSFWPAAFLSLIFVGASTVLSDLPALLCLAAGLAGFCTLAAANRFTRYYITNFRVLVRRRSLRGGRYRWSVIHHKEIARCSTARRLASNNLNIEGAERTVEIRGLNATELEIAYAVLREKLPEGACAPRKK